MRRFDRSLLSFLWLAASFLGTNVESSNTSRSVYRVRNQHASRYTPPRNLQQDATNFIPSFSKDDGATVEVSMPTLTLLMFGLDGSPLGEAAYDTLQTAMDDYLLKALESYFLISHPDLEMIDLKSHVTSDVPLDTRGNALEMETTLLFLDSKPTGGVQATTRQADAQDSSESLLSNLELELAAGHVWKDLSVLQNHLLVAAAVDDTSAFDGLVSIEAKEDFPTSTTAEDTSANEILLEDPSIDEIFLGDPPPPKQEQRPEPSSTDSNLQIAGVSSSQLSKQSGTDALNPLWPSLIVGMAVFLITIIVLGYRKQQSARRKSSWEEDVSTKSDSVMVKIVANGTGDLEEGDSPEIEVEDRKFGYHQQEEDLQKLEREEFRNMQRNLDKQYATSCLTLGGAAALGGAGLSREENSDGNYVYYPEAEQPKKTCLPKLGKAKKEYSEIEDSSAGVLTSNSNRGIYLPRSVDLTDSVANGGLRQSFDEESWRNPQRLRSPEEPSTDLTPVEKSKFTSYIQSGMTIEEASSLIMKDRNSDLFSEHTHQAPSVIPPKSNGNGQEQSNLLDCCNPSLTTAQPPKTMEDDEIAVHIPKPAYMSLGAACSTKDPNLLRGITDSNNEQKGRAMVISEASSYASSYDDNEFSKALEGDYQ